jgi:hypothetical protein
VEVHEAHFAPDCPDIEWMQIAAERGWLILTKDRRVRHRPIELEVIRSSGAAAFILTAGDVSGADQAASFVYAAPRILKLAASRTRPLIVSISRNGAVTVIEGVRLGGVRRDT